MADRVFFDFDGTLIDSSRRLYSLFMELAPESSFSYEDYWRIKRGRITQRDLLRQYLDYTEEQILVFKQRWLAHIEDPVRLDTDVPFAGVSDFLQKLSSRKKLFLVTARQYPDRAKAQIRKFGWDAFWTDIFVTQQAQSKASLVCESLSCDATDIFIGDTGEDIMAGKEMGMKTVAVSSGVLSPDVLREYAPDQLLDTVVKFDADCSL